jgi:hypothetical protein
VQSAAAILQPALAGSSGLTFVVFGTVAFSLLMSVLMLVTRGHDSMYDQIGQGGISRESDYSGGEGMIEHSPAARAEQEQEVRQMLKARSDRLVRAGRPALDIDAEVARLLAPGEAGDEHDPGLVAEVRQMVLARNERRIRQGAEPLDVEQEVARTLAELSP